MAIILSLAGVFGRFASRIVNASLGWAAILLFGRVPQSKQLLLSFVTLGSIAWVVLVLTLPFPDLATFLLTLVPLPSFVDRNLVRLALIVAAAIMPLFIGAASIVLADSSRRPHGLGKVWAVLRGYPFCVVLAFTLVFLAALAFVRKMRALIRRWEDAHVPVVVKPGCYDDVAADIRDALDGAGLGVRERPAPRVLALPAHLLAAVAGGGVRDLVPDRLMELVSGDLEVLLHPSDIALAGTKVEVARARAAIAARLTDAPAYLTTSAESHAVEDQIESIAHGADGADSAGLRRKLDEVDGRLASLTVPYEEWETLYRMRLQVERRLLEGGAIPAGEPSAGDFGEGRDVEVPPAKELRTTDTFEDATEPVVLWTTAVAFLLAFAGLLLTIRDRVVPKRSSCR